MDQVCSNNACITRPVHQPGELVAELRLLNQVREGDSSISGHLGKGEASLRDHSAPPADDRKVWSVATGRCKQSFEINGAMDYTGSFYTSTPSKSLGHVTFVVADAPGKIVLEEFPLSSGGVGYGHMHEPPRLKQGATIYSDFFDPAYVSLGSPFEVQLAGGADVATQTLAANAMPQPFTITSPPDFKVTKTKVKVSGGMTVSWSPAQPDASMEVFIVKQGPSPDYAPLLACYVKDTGSLAIPPEALTPFTGDVTIQLRKQVVRYHQLSTKAGTKGHFYVMGRHARLRLFHGEN